MLPFDTFSLLIAIVVCIAFTIIFWLRSFKRRSTVLLLGICESGKTALFSQLLFKKTFPSHTSLEENKADYHNDRENIKLVDIPGHEKLRFECLAKYKTDTKASIFVLDSKDIQSNLKDVAEYLYNVLTDAEIARNRNKFLIACNKQDSSTAKGSVVIRSMLEKELNTLTVTRTGALAGLDKNAQPHSVTLTKPGSQFTFSTSRVPVEFIECSAIENGDAVEKWLQKI